MPILTGFGAVHSGKYTKMGAAPGLGSYAQLWEKCKITEELEWWKDQAFVGELVSWYKNWLACKEKGYSKSEVDEGLETMRKNRI